MAMMKLDGAPVTGEELALAAVAPECVAPGPRAAAVRAAGLVRLALDIEEDRVGAAAPSRPASPAATGFAAAGLEAVLEGLALLEIETAAEPAGSEERGAPLDAGPALPWSGGWLMALHRRWAGFDGQPEAGDAGVFDDGAGLVEATLRAEPGLTGGCRALIRLHRLDDPPAERMRAPDAFEDALSRRLRDYGSSATAGFWPSVARLGAAALLRRACTLDHVHLPLAVGFASDATAFREILAGPEDDAVGWLLVRIAALAETETDAVAATARRQAALTAAIGNRRRDSRVPDLLDRLWREPAVTVAGAASALGVTSRAARLTIAALTGAGILRGVPAWHETLEDPSDPGSAKQPHPRAWLVVDRSPPPANGKHRRRAAGQGEPPPGTPMRWRPIETAPRNGRRVLVWAGRSVMASHGRIGGLDAPAWHDGRRILRPSHWLPITPPSSTGEGG
ncbi:hypothetical protein [Skermanella aerolata]|uniref:hypothetical protein n=3 Tax=Skermanella aerolata TaxID=393310 RepID=UPI0012FC93D8|nr:hypothetical protein [Skermanella aerolata]